MRKKTVIISTALLSFGCLSAQVGINTQTPNATLDIAAKEANGTSTKVEGLLIPRLDRQRAQSMEVNAIPESTLIYVQDATTGAQAGIAANIDTIGYYFFNGSVWMKLNNGSSNGSGLYNSDGVIAAPSGTRTVTTDGNTINFTNGNNSVAIASGTTANPNEGKIRVNGSSNGSVEVVGGSGTGSSAIDIFSDSDSSQIVAKGASKSLTISTQSNDAAPIILKTNNADRMIVSETGNVGIGDISTPIRTLHVKGTARITESSGTPEGIVGRNRSGDIGTVYVGEGLSLSGGTLSANKTNISNVVFPFLAIQPAKSGMYVLDSKEAPNYTLWNSASNPEGECDILLPSPDTMIGRTLNIIAALDPVDVCTQSTMTPLTWMNSQRIGVIPRRGRVTIQASDEYDIGGMWVITMKDFDITP